MFTLRRGHCAPTVAVGLLSALLLAGAAETAQAGKGSRGGKGSRPAQTGTTAQIVAQLRATHALLHKANHDYKGHRVRAMHEIAQAIRALAPHQQQQNTQSGQGGQTTQQQPRQGGQSPTQGQGNQESQAVSDGQLRQAIQQLQAVQGRLGSSTNGNAATASAAVNRAIQELQTALQVSPATGTNN